MFFVLISTMTFAQKGTAINLAVDTLQGDETVNFEVMEFRAPHTVLTITGLCTQLGGTSDGTLALYGSIDGTNYVLINGVGAGVITASPQDSITGADLNQITIADALVVSWVIKDLPYKYYRPTGVGTLADTTKVQFKYLYK